ncbi:FecR domain-containing protein [Shimia sediminis]|uniref:FecR domain-containing protein n=1 Tax=Shimia sediminis TaxID=2497945 RepID=UPI000F8E9A54|nr:FecR domain-containing protein [Shimia sediminis]
MFSPAFGTWIPRVLGVLTRVWLPLLVLSSGVTAVAETDELDAPYELVEYSGDETLRDFVARYLNDPDLWPTVLRINQFASPADLSPGVVIQMPVRQVMLADDALATSLVAIQKATAEGARLFAPKQIGDAIETREEAIDKRGEGEWRLVVNYAGDATVFANEAFEISLEQRDRAAEALITDIQGNVEGRDPTEAAWSDRDLNDILVEFERLRTLTNSTTQVTFRDLSRLRLNPNSNATIQRMRSDPLTGKEVTKVSLASGDFYALLNQLSDQDSFEIDVPGIKTTTESNDFWIKNDTDSARFVNFDAESLDIRAGDQMVSLGLDEGVVITADGATAKTEALDRATLIAPLDNDEVYGTAVSLSWEPFPEAAGYWLELAGDPGFNRMIATEWGVSTTGFNVADLTPGLHYWRVAALDQLGLPGKWSETREFDLRIDTTPPFLTLLAPGDGIIVEEASIDILGASEDGVTLTLNGQNVPVASDGGFLVNLPLQPGMNTYVLTATDRAGNRSQKRQTIDYRPRQAATITLDADLPREGDTIVTRNAEQTVTATTTANAGLDVLLQDAAGDLVGQTRVETGGRIALTAPATDTSTPFTITILSDGGAPLGQTGFNLVRDTQAPVLVLDEHPPRSSFEETLTLSGTVQDAAGVTLGGTPLELDDTGGFEITVTLAPGSNAFELRALDAAGNVTLLALETALDIDPPEILAVRAERPEGDNGPIEIEVEARDPSGLRQAAQFIVEIGANEREGYLRCDSDTGLCRATLPAEAGEVTVIEVVVLDYAGNEAFW